MDIKFTIYDKYSTIIKRDSVGVILKNMKTTKFNDKDYIDINLILNRFTYV